MNNTFYNENNRSGLKRADFRRTIDGKQTDLFILTNAHGYEVALTNYGGALLAVMVPDRNGNISNVVLGHDTLEHVINSPEPFLSTLIGRYGNRIAKGRFTLEGQTVELNINNGPNSLHGGPTGFHRRVWDATQNSPAEVTLTYTSPHGEEGFPGTVELEVTFTFTDDNELKLSYRGRTDRTTVLNPTHHAFFNLAGVANPTPSVENCRLTIEADFYTPIDEVSIPTGEIAPVAGTPMDFRTPHIVGSRIGEPFTQLIHGAGYDHNYVIRKAEAGALAPAARCVEPNSGRTLEVYTTEPGIQLYTANWLNGFAGWHGATFPARSAICFEAQHFPDSPNKPHFPGVTLRPGQEYRQLTIYKFGTE